MVSGTINNESHMQASEVQSNPELVFLAEKASKGHIDIMSSSSAMIIPNPAPKKS